MHLTPFLVCHVCSELFLLPVFRSTWVTLMMMKFYLLSYDPCKMLFFLMEIPKVVREKHGKYLNTETYQSSVL